MTSSKTGDALIVLIVNIYFFKKCVNHTLLPHLIDLTGTPAESLMLPGWTLGVGEGLGPEGTKPQGHLRLSGGSCPYDSAPPIGP